jgi:3-oxoacyl-[acyl-carrier protein] reductase
VETDKMGEFSGGYAIVTGGTRGIGRAVSLALISQGAHVTAVYSGDDASAQKFLADAGAAAQIARLDVSDYAACEAFYKSYEERHGTLDILVNSAGVRRDGIVGMMKEEDWRRVVDINLTGSFNMSKFAVKIMMKKRYGRIISITSPVGRIGFAGQANYAASKAGQVGFTRALAKEVATRKITVNLVSPGFIDTDFISGLPPEQRKEYEAMVPMRRFGTPEEVASAVMFLAGGKASYITGATLEISGGL